MKSKNNIKRWIWIFLGGMAVLLAAGAGLVWYWMQQPLYTPGMVRQGAGFSGSLQPPAQTGGGSVWMVEPGIQLYHFSKGSGKNVLLVHGGPAFPIAKPWAGLDPLTGQFQFHYYDQRGCGKSSRPVERLSSNNTYENMQLLNQALGLGAQVADIERIRQILGEEKLVLVGHSFGGMIASLYAAEFPERVQALVLVAPAETIVMPPIHGGLFEEIKPLLPPEMRASFEGYLKRLLDFNNLSAHSEQSMAELHAEILPYYQAAARAKGWEVRQEVVQNGGWAAEAMYISMGMRHDYRPPLKQVTAPVLVVHGGKDLQPEVASRIYSEAFTNARFVVIPGSGHFPFEDQPAEFARVVGEFLSSSK